MRFWQDCDRCDKQTGSPLVLKSENSLVDAVLPALSQVGISGHVEQRLGFKFWGDS
jgi:hypothetical protein